MGRKLHHAEICAIERLPDDLLRLIMSFLRNPTLVQMARTSIVSRGWRKLWLSTTCLDFDASTVLSEERFESGESGQVDDAWYISWVNQVINSRVALFGLQPVKEIRIRYPLNKSHAPHINHWVNFAIANRVEALRLEFSVYNTVIGHNVQYTLSEECWRSVPSGLSSLKCLKSLSLVFVDVSKQFIEFILSSCPLLEDLSLVFAGCYRDLDVSGVPPLQLRRLKIDSSEEFALSKLCAPYLTSLYYSSRKFDNQIIDVPSLTDLTIGGKRGLQPISEWLGPFWSYLPQLVKLELMTGMHDSFLFEEMPKLVNLKYLKISMIVGDTDPIFYEIIKFIDSCPALETFAMEIFSIHKQRRRTMSTQRQKKIMLELHERCSLTCLKEVELYGANGETIDQLVTKFIIRNASQLWKLTVDIRDTYHKPNIVPLIEAKAKELCRGSCSEIVVTVIG